MKCCTISPGFNASVMQQLHVSCFFISLQTNTRDIRKSHLFSFSHQALPRKCQPVYVNQAAAGHWSCWTPGRVQHGPLSPTSEITCTSECLFPIPCLPLLACSCYFQSWCFVHSENLFLFFFQSLHFNYYLLHFKRLDVLR